MHLLLTEAGPLPQDPPPPSKGMGMSRNQAILAFYPSRPEAEAAFRGLLQSGCDTRHLGIIGREHWTSTHVVGYYNVGDRMKAWGLAGAFWGGLWGLCFGAYVLGLPLSGALLAAGPVTSLLLGACEGALAVGGFSMLAAAFYHLGMPRNSLLRYELAVKTGPFALYAHGSPQASLQAREFLRHAHRFGQEPPR